MKKKTLIITLSLILTITALAGCGDTTETASIEASAEETVTSVETTEVEPAVADEVAEEPTSTEEAQPSNYMYQTIYDGSASVPECLYEDMFCEDSDDTNIGLCDMYGEEFLEQRAQRSKELMEIVFNQSHNNATAIPSNEVLPYAISSIITVPFLDYEKCYETYIKGTDLENDALYTSNPVLFAFSLYAFYIENELTIEAEYITDKSLVWRIDNAEPSAELTQILSDRYNKSIYNGGSTPAMWLNRGLLCFTITECNEEGLETVAKALNLPDEKVEIGKEYKVIIDLENATGVAYNVALNETVPGSVDDWDLINMYFIRYVD